MSRLFVARHGATPWSQVGRLQGRAEVGLSRKGWQQAEIIAEIAPTLRPTRLHASPRARTWQTAQVVGRRTGLPVLPTPALAEIDYGIWTGRTARDAARLTPALTQAWWTTPWMTRLPGNDSLHHLAGRLIPFLRRIAQHPPDTCTLCITHGHVIRTLLAITGQQPPDAFWDLDVPHGVVLEIVLPSTLSLPALPRHN